METHGSESYFVIGEGLLDESVDGRARRSRRQSTAAAPPFRFSRMGPRGDRARRGEPPQIANAMTAGGGGDTGIPAGYTYLGQFVDHDLTFDKTTVMLGQNVSPAELLQARSPSLDLDSLYGAGPGDPESARFYSDDRHLKMGKTAAIDPDPAFEGHDLPRGAGTTQKAKRRAIIPDKRNDENLAVAQTHLAFIRFHNRVVDTLPASVPAAQRFEKARELAVKHYQWMLRHDYLPRICEPSVVDDVFANGRKAFEVGATPTRRADDAGRVLGRRVPARPQHDPARLQLEPAFPRRRGRAVLPVRLLRHERRPRRVPAAAEQLDRGLPPAVRLQGRGGRDNLAAPRGLNRAMRIDTLLVNPLRFLPRGSFGGKAADEGTIVANLAFRNLARAKMVKLATGQKMAAFLKSKGVPVTALTKPQIRNGDGGAKLDALTPAQREGLAKNTPLWFYVLREAELNDGRLKGVGARIVAETFHRAMEGSQHSIVRDPAWRPTFGPNSTTFRMVDLLLFAFEGKKKLLAPLGP